MAWHFGLWTLSGTPIGEVLNASERRLSLRLNGLNQASFTTRLDNPLVDEIVSRDGDVLIGVWKDSSLQFVGELTTAEEIGPGYRHIISREGLVNQALSVEGEAAFDLVSIAARGQFEEVVPAGELSAGLRQALLAAHVGVRATPKHTVTFEPGQTGSSFSANFGGPLWRLARRIYRNASGDAFNTQPRTDILIELLNLANLAHDTGIRVGTVETSAEVAELTYTYKPVAEAFSEFASTVLPRDAENPSMTSPIYQDDWCTQSGVLNGKQVAGSAGGAGVNWATAGDATDLNTATDCNATRSATSGGRWGYVTDGTAATDKTATIVQVRSNRSAIPTSGIVQSGAIARYQNTNNWVGAIYKTDGSGASAAYRLNVIKKTTAGGEVVLGWVDSGAGTSREVRLQVEVDGTWAAWEFQVGDTPGTPLITGQDTDLATGGTLASGKVGFYDAYGGSDSILRSYAAFKVATPTIGLGWDNLDFEFVPNVPVADTFDGPLGPTTPGVKCWTFNSYKHLGSSRPNVVFEFGSGARPIASQPGMAFGVDWFVGDTVTTRAKIRASSTARFDSPVRIRGVDITLTKEAKEEIVPLLEDE